MSKQILNRPTSGCSPTLTKVEDFAWQVVRDGVNTLRRSPLGRESQGLTDDESVDSLNLLGVTRKSGPPSSEIFPRVFSHRALCSLTAGAEARNPEVGGTMSKTTRQHSENKTYRTVPAGNSPAPQRRIGKRAERTAGGLETGLLKERPCHTWHKRALMLPIAATRQRASSGKVLPKGWVKTRGSSHRSFPITRHHPAMGLLCPLGLNSQSSPTSKTAQPENTKTKLRLEKGGVA